MNVLLFSNDLIAQSRIGGAATSAGLASVVVTSASRLLEAITDSAVVVLDLTKQGCDSAVLILTPKGPSAIIGIRMTGWDDEF